MFKIRVYDKSDHPAEKYSWILTTIAFALMGIWYLIDDGQPGPFKYLLYIAFALIMVTAVISVIHKVRHYGPIGEVNNLTVDDHSISFMDKRVQISNVSKIVIRLRSKEIQSNHIDNNYMEIVTQHGETYKFAVLIGNNNDIIQIGKMVSSLKPKVKNLTYENYL
ncbi:hypothetical protein WBG78_23110 [Chryseolinea sp. T2]|uniref:hypothetical protein n=1 Tax=Chryseolinea sp. T2 TaxID=3129255 RepID=UPI003077E6E2